MGQNTRSGSESNFNVFASTTLLLTLIISSDRSKVPVAYLHTYYFVLSQISDSYEQGSKVRFTCSKPGYIPINPQPIECVEQPECKIVKPLGITSGRIPDSAINATSERGNYEARNIR